MSRTLGRIISTSKNFNIEYKHEEDIHENISATCENNNDEDGISLHISYNNSSPVTSSYKYAKIFLNKEDAYELGKWLLERASDGEK